jgi:hypothetical protein
MSYVTKSIAYFGTPGRENTRDCAELAIARAKELGIRDIVVASTTGETAGLFHTLMKGTGLRLIAVSHAVGYAKPGVWEFKSDTADRLRTEGSVIVTGTHALSGLERAMSGNARIGGGSRSEAVAEALRRTIATGLKVAVECVLIAADQGAIPVENEVIAVGGTAEGADTVAVIRPAHTASYFDLQVREIVAMPRNR